MKNISKQQKSRFMNSYTVFNHCRPCNKPCKGTLELHNYNGRALFVDVKWERRQWKISYRVAQAEIHGCSYSRTTPGATTIQELHWRKNLVAVITQEKMIDDNLKRQIKKQTLCNCRLFLLVRIFQYISNWLKQFEHLPTLSLQYT